MSTAITRPLLLLVGVAIVLAAGCARKGSGAALIEAASEGDSSRCERLVRRGVFVDATDADGDTAMDWAIYYCHADAVRTLLKLGADVNHADSGNFTPLLYTAAPLRGRFLRGTQAERNEIAQMLIRHGADVNHAMGDGHLIGSGQTTLHFAAIDRNADLVRTLLASGANPNVKSNQGYTPLDVAKFPNYAPNNEVINALEGR